MRPVHPSRLHGPERPTPFGAASRRNENRFHVVERPHNPPATQPPMRPHVRFVFVLHNHQPVGNFDSVFAEAY